MRTSSGCGVWCPSVSIAGRRSSCTRSSDSAGWRRASAAKVGNSEGAGGPGPCHRGDDGREGKNARDAVLGARALGSGCCALVHPKALSPERLWERGFRRTTLKRRGSHDHGGLCVSALFQAACCCTNRTSLRSLDCAVSLVLTAPRPASAESPSSWMAAPGTSAARTVRASTCCGTAR